MWDRPAFEEFLRDTAASVATSMQAEPRA
jgi:hypothetical protein